MNPCAHIYTSFGLSEAVHFLKVKSEILGVDEGSDA